MKWLKGLLIALLVMAGGAIMVPMVFISGCIAVGDSLVEMPPLHVKGRVVTPDGTPVSGENVALGLSTWVYDGETYAAVRNHRDPVDHATSWVVHVETDPNGVFEHVFPERSYLHPSAFVFWIPVGGHSPTDLRLLIVPEDGDGEAFWVRVHGEKAVLRMVEEEVKLPPNAEVTAQRSENKDYIEVALVVPAKPEIAS